jgi:hypothetical protein
MRRFALLALSTLFATAALAHQLSAPTTVTADASGHFSYVITLNVESTTEFAYWELNGSDNTDLGWQVGDGFCLMVVEPGTYETPVEGNLLDLDAQAIIHYTHALCDGWMATVDTTVLPGGVAVVPATWGTVKSLYR